jgi:hypothetical protein
MIIIFIYKLIIKRFQIGVNHQIENDYQNHWRICDSFFISENGFHLIDSFPLFK